MPPRRSPLERDKALTALALTGSSTKAAEMTGISRRTISDWADKHPERYAQVQAELAPQIDAQVVAELRQVATTAAHGTLAALQLEQQRIADGEVKDASASAKNQALAAGIAIDKVAVMEGRPTSIVEHRSADDVLKAMDGKGFVDSTAHEDSSAPASDIALLPESSANNVRASTGQPV